VEAKLNAENQSFERSWYLKEGKERRKGKKAMLLQARFRQPSTCWGDCRIRINFLAAATRASPPDAAGIYACWKLSHVGEHPMTSPGLTEVAREFSIQTLHPEATSAADAVYDAISLILQPAWM
jgi:hypothetical protein